MARQCYHCNEQIEQMDVYCPYCAAKQSSPGDPFIGYLLQNGFEILAIVLIIMVLTSCAFSLLLNWLF